MNKKIHLNVFDNYNSCVEACLEESTKSKHKKLIMDGSRVNKIVMLDGTEIVYFVASHPKQLKGLHPETLTVYGYNYTESVLDQLEVIAAEIDRKIRYASF